MTRKSRDLSRRQALVVAGGALATPMLAAGIARAADDWPNRPVKYIVVFPAGGPTDTLSRIAAREPPEMAGPHFLIARPARAHRGARALGDDRPAIHHRQPRRFGRQCRRRDDREVGARRLHRGPL